MVSMDGRVLRPPTETAGGDVGTDTEFRFRQAGDMVWGRYSGGRVRLGFLVGRSDGTTMDFRYTQLTTDGQTATGHSTDRIEVLDDGRVRLQESWSWDSRDGSGTSVLEEVPAGG